MKKYNPTTPGRRQMSSVTYHGVLSGDRPHKRLTKGANTSGGRNNKGRMTSRRRGGGHKRRFRDIDFRMEKVDVPFRVASIEYDPNRSGFIGRVIYIDGEQRYTLLPQSVAVGDERVVSKTASPTPGNRTPLSKISIGTMVYNIELREGSGARLARSAGTYAEVVAKENEYVHIKMPSSEIRRIPANAWASIGVVSNEEHHLISLGKAGRNRHMNRRPKVTGRSMNAVDHPMGGGEAHARGARKRRKNKWGKAVNPLQKSRKSRKYSDSMIVQRRRKKRK